MPATTLRIEKTNPKIESLRMMVLEVTKPLLMKPLLVNPPSLTLTEKNTDNGIPPEIAIAFRNSLISFN